jgi:hypothetical protein
LEGESTLGVQVGKREVPARGHFSAKEVKVEVMKRGGFMFMSTKFQTISLNYLNMILATSLICTEMEVPRVFVSFYCSTDLGSLFPNRQLGVSGARQN